LINFHLSPASFPTVIAEVGFEPMTTPLEIAVLPLVSPFPFMSLSQKEFYMLDALKALILAGFFVFHLLLNFF